MNRFLFILLCGTLALGVQAQEQRELTAAEKADAEWLPTGEWPFLNRRFFSAEVYTGFINPRKTQVPCNIHIGNQTLWYSLRDTLMEALPGNINRVVFENGDVYMPILKANAFGKIVHEDDYGKVLRVRRIDERRQSEEARSASHLGSLSIQGDAGFNLNIDLISTYEGNPQKKPLAVIDYFYFIFGGEIFEVTDRNVLRHIPEDRRKAYKAFTRSAEILSHNQSSIMKIWNEFFVTQENSNF